MYPRFKYISNIKSPQGPWDGLHAPKLNSARPGLANTAPADVPDIEPARLGLACSKTPHLPTFPTSSPLGSTWPARKHRTCRRFRHRACSARPGVLEITAPADVSDIEPARLGLACSKTPHLPTFPTSSPLGSAGALEMAARARSALLGRSKWPFEVARLHACCTQHRDEHSRAWNARVRTIYIYIYLYPYIYIYIYMYYIYIYTPYPFWLKCSVAAHPRHPGDCR
jgi:hypothetical protein